MKNSNYQIIPHDMYTDIVQNIISWIYRATGVYLLETIARDIAYPVLTNMLMNSNEHALIRSTLMQKSWSLPREMES